MSENTFPFGDEGPVYDAAHDDGEAAEAGRSRTAMLAAGGVAFALLLAGGAYLLLGGGGSDELATGAGAPPVRRAAPASSTPSAAPSPGSSKLPAAFKEPLGRDPFRALYLAPVAPSAAAATAAPTGTTGTGTTGTTITTGTTGSTTSTTITTGTGTSGTSATGMPQVVIVTPPSASASPAARPTAVATTPATTPASPTAKEYAVVFKGTVVSKGKQYGVFTIDGAPVRVLAPTDPEKPTLFGPTNELGLADLQRDSKGHVTAAIRIGESGFDLTVGQTAYVR